MLYCFSCQYKNYEDYQSHTEEKKKKSFNFSNEKNRRVAQFLKSVNKAAPSKRDFSSVSTMVF